MFKRIGRRFYSAKYVYVVHLHSVSPWFMHDRPAKVVWKRGTKKHKKGETSVKSPTRTEGTGVNGTLDIEEGFELGVTLYSESNRTRKSGPYAPKELKLVIAEVEEDGSLFSVLGALSINLSEYVGGISDKKRLPIECDHEIIDAVGQPYLEFTVQAWYKPGLGGMSASSGISSTGWTAHEGSDAEEEDPTDLSFKHAASLDPVKPFEGLESQKTLGIRFATGTENIEANSTARQENENAEVLTDTTEKPSRTAILLDPSTDSNATPNGQEQSEVLLLASEGRNDDDATQSPTAMAQTSFKDDAANPLFYMNTRHGNKLSTIDSEMGDDIEEYVRQNDDLNKFPENELEEKEDEDEGLVETLPSTISLTGDTEKTDNASTEFEFSRIADNGLNITPTLSVITESDENKPSKSVPVVTAESLPLDSVGKTNDTNGDKSTPIEPWPKSLADDNENATKETSPPANTTPRKPVTAPSHPPKQNKPAPRTQSKPSGQCWCWIPGRNLVCCQPALPREP